MTLAGPRARHRRGSPSPAASPWSSAHAMRTASRERHRPLGRPRPAADFVRPGPRGGAGVTIRGAGGKGVHTRGPRPPPGGPSPPKKGRTVSAPPPHGPPPHGESKAGRPSRPAPPGAAPALAALAALAPLAPGDSPLALWTKGRPGTSR